MRDMQKFLDMWGAWAGSDSCSVDYSPIAAGFTGLLPQTGKTRLQCTDDDGLIIEGGMASLKRKKPDEYQLLVVHYIYRISKRQMAKHRKKNEKQISIEIQMAEGFIEGCLSMLDLPLEMDPIVQMENRQKNASAVRKS